MAARRETPGHFLAVMAIYSVLEALKMALAGLSLGTVLAVSANQPSTYDSSGFAALTYTTVGEITSIPEFGGSAQVNQSIPIATGIVNKRAGSYDYGTSSLSIARDAADTGQIALKSGFDGANKGVVHSVKITLPSGVFVYFTAVITSFTLDLNDANSWQNHSVTLELTNSVLFI